MLMKYILKIARELVALT